MNVVPALIWLQGGPDGPGGLLQSPMVPMIAIVAIFYFLMIRPQNKQRREHEAELKAIEKGDNIVTSGGIHGKVTGVTDDVITVEIAAIKGERVRVKVSRPRIESVQKPKKGEAS